MDTYLWLSVPVGFFTAIAVGTHYYYKNAFKYWQDRGIQSPKAYPIFGNLAMLLADPTKPSQWLREFGKVYGIYEGSGPVLVISDPELIRLICIKEFNKFSNHPNNEFNSELSNNFVFAMQDEDWRRVRNILTPAFTSGKIRRMFKLINVCADDLVAAMEERIKLNPVVNLKDLFGLYTMDAIAACCYGLRIMGYKDETNLATAASRDEFVNLALKLFDFSIWRLLLIMTLNKRLAKLLKLKFISEKVERAFSGKVQRIIERRQESGKSFDDYLQSLIDANLGNSNNKQVSPDEDRLDSLEKHHLGTRSDTDDSEQKTIEGTKTLSEVEMLAAATFLLVVGLETTSTLLTSCFYALSFHQDVQEKLYQILRSIAKEDDQKRPIFDYEELTSCQYLDAVVCETLRNFPPAMQTDRISNEDYYLESHKLFMPKESRVVFSLKAMMQDPDYWPEPLVFDPERFMPENQHKIVPNSYCPFGIGPRHCLGMRFSLTESKMALAKLLMDYKFEPAPGCSYPPVMKINIGLGNIKRPEVKVVRR